MIDLIAWSPPSHSSPDKHTGTGFHRISDARLPLVGGGVGFTVFRDQSRVSFLDWYLSVLTFGPFNVFMETSFLAFCQYVRVAFPAHRALTSQILKS